MSSINRPVQIQEFILALREIPDEQLITIKQELAKSIQKLLKTNEKLKKLAEGESTETANDEGSASDEEEYYDVSKEDTNLFKQIVHENEVVVGNQQTRVDAVDEELTYRGIKHEKLIF